MLTPATITVNFTANYAGAHRICWRQCNIGQYVCTNIIECVGGGNVCSATINIMVDPESCTPVCFEGYIQATCNPENSSVGQVPWTTTFTPTPTCSMYSITCTSPILNQPCGVIPAATMGLDCNGTARPDVGPINDGTSVYVCAIGLIPNLPSGYVMTLFDGCCTDCEQYTITISPANPPISVLDGSSIYYIDCTTRELIRIDLTGNIPFAVTACMVIGSINTYLTPEAIGVITQGVPCP
jgi:hypothetical protein